MTSPAPSNRGQAEQPGSSEWKLLPLLLIPAACCGLPLLLVAAAAVGAAMLGVGIVAAALLAIGVATIVVVRRRQRC